MATPGTHHQGQDAQDVIELAVGARWCAEDEGEHGGVQADHGRAPRSREAGDDEWANGQQPNQAELAPEDGIDHGHD